MQSGWSGGADVLYRNDFGAAFAYMRCGGNRNNHDFAYCILVSVSVLKPRRGKYFFRRYCYESRSYENAEVFVGNS